MARCKECNQVIPSARSVKQNSFRWVIVNWLFQHDNHDFPNAGAYHKWLKAKAGWVEPVLDKNGNVLYFVLTKTDFKTMPQKKFNEYFEAIQDVIWKYVIPNHGEEFEQELCDLLSVFR